MHWPPINVVHRCLTVADRAQQMLATTPRIPANRGASTLPRSPGRRGRYWLYNEFPPFLRCGSLFQCVPTRRGPHRLTLGLHGREWETPRRTVQAALQCQLPVSTASSRTSWFCKSDTTSVTPAAFQSAISSESQSPARGRPSIASRPLGTSGIQYMSALIVVQRASAKCLLTSS